METIKLTPKEAQERCGRGWVLRLVNPNQKGDKNIKERDYEILGKWEKKKFSGEKNG